MNDEIQGLEFTVGRLKVEIFDDEEAPDYFGKGDDQDFRNYLTSALSIGARYMGRDENNEAEQRFSRRIAKVEELIEQGKIDPEINWKYSKEEMDEARYGEKVKKVKRLARREKASKR